MPALAAIAAIVSASAAAGGLGYSIYSGQKAAGQQEQGLQMQKTAQQQAIQRALSTQRQNAIAANAANMRAPDVSSILQRAALAAKGGVGSTMLTGSSGVNPSELSLGKTNPLGS